MPKLSARDRRRRREIYRQLYRLEHRYGDSVDLYKYEQGDLDEETGEHTTTTREKVVIRRFISFQVDIGGKFEYDISFIKANANFAYGGVFEVGDRVGIISRREIDESFELDLAYYFVLNGERFNIHRYVDLDARAGFLVHIRKVNAQQLHQELTPIVQHHIDLTQTIVATI